MRSLDVARNVVRRAVVFIPRGTVAAALLGKGPVVTAWRASEQRRTFFSKEKSKSVYEYGAHRSDAEELIAEVPIVMVDGEVALCDGGTRLSSCRSVSLSTRGVFDFALLSQRVGKSYGQKL